MKATLFSSFKCMKTVPQLLVKCLLDSGLQAGGNPAGWLIGLAQEAWDSRAGLLRQSLKAGPNTSPSLL